MESLPMHPRLRFWLIVATSVTIGVVAAFGIADQSYALAGLAAGAVVWLALEWRDGARPEAWLLALVIAGYILANRGFAQLSVAPNLPLLPAELALLAGSAGLLIRVALRQARLGTGDALNVAIVLWVALGTARLWSDFRVNGAMALRDFATVYYAAFFFLAQALAAHAPSERLVRRVLVGACAILPVSYLLFSQHEEWVLGHITFRGTPLVFYKDDLVAAYLFCGMFLFLALAGGPRWLRGGWAALAYGSAFTINSSRAAIVGLCVTCGWWAAARRWAPWKLQAVAIPVGVAALGVAALVQQKPLHDTRLYVLYEHVASMVDFTGTGHYATEDRRYVGDNNRFRLAWWQSVAEETFAEGPLLGVGFGYDLTERFVRTYQGDLGDDFNTRSPHSVLFTVLGRMGLIGLAAFLAIVAAMAARTWTAVQEVRAGGDLTTLGWWSVAWVVFTSACFGVVLEGPMGAVIFWSALGFANALTPRTATARAAEDPRTPTGSRPEPQTPSSTLPDAPAAAGPQRSSVSHV